jgi:hypothetical protein
LAPGYVITRLYGPVAPVVALHSSSGLPLLSVAATQETSLSPAASVIVKVPPFVVVMKLGGPGVAAKLKITAAPPIWALPLVGVTVMFVTFPITVAEEVEVRA